MTQLAARRSSIVAAFVAVCVIWGSTYFVLRLALEGFPPFLISAIRFLLAGGVLYTVLRLRGERAPTAPEWGGAIVTGALFFVIGNGLVNVAEQSVSSGLVSVLVATMPLWVTLFQRLGGAVVTRREWTGIGLGLAGVVVLNLGSDLRGSGLGALCALAAPVGWALGSVGSARLPLPRGAMRTAAQMLAGGVATLLVSLARGERLPAAPTARPILAVLYLAIFGSLVGFSAYSFLLRHTRAAVATSYAYVNPVIALLLGLRLGGERVGLTSAIGSAITLGAVLLLTGAKARQAPIEPAPELGPGLIQGGTRGATAVWNESHHRHGSGCGQRAWGAGVRTGAGRRGNHHADRRGGRADGRLRVGPALQHQRRMQDRFLRAPDGQLRRERGVRARAELHFRGRRLRQADVRVRRHHLRQRLRGKAEPHQRGEPGPVQVSLTVADRSVKKQRRRSE